MPALAELKSFAIINSLRSRQLFTGLPAADLENIAAVMKGVGHAAGIWFQRLDNEGDDGLGRKILATLFPAAMANWPRKYS